jgi:hypothetical protein
MKIIKYEHYGRQMNVFEELKGKHAQHCLCFAECKYFKPNTPDNCIIAQTNYELDCKYGVTTPVWECEKFEQ